MSEAAPDLSRSGYAALAAEYYDAGRHPTCAAFREASRQLLEHLLPPAPLVSRAVEVGSGASLLAEIVSDRGQPLDGLVLTDQSPGMLEHSRHWATLGCALELAAADDLPAASGTVALLVASLADPYDDDAFWQEVRRVLAPGGRAIVTTPSWIWASRFRVNGAPPDRARFVLASGDVLDVPSLVRPPAHELELIQRHGLHEQRMLSVSRGELSTSAPKLDVLDASDAVVTAHDVIG